MLPSELEKLGKHFPDTMVSHINYLYSMNCEEPDNDWNSLSDAFCWMDTPQGEEFWNTIYGILYNKYTGSDLSLRLIKITESLAMFPPPKPKYKFDDEYII